MPELPDVDVYVAALAARIVGTRLQQLQVINPFVLRTVTPTAAAFAGRQAVGVSRLGKRVVLAFEDELFAVLHLMIAGRLHWSTTVPKRRGLLRMQFDDGWLLLTEAGTKRRASLHLVAGAQALAAMDPGGREVLTMPFEAFAQLVGEHNHTLKRFLTDPRLLSGIGNAYSDEILHAAMLSPVRLTSRLTPEEVRRLFDATCTTLETWCRRLDAHYAQRFPTKVTAFREGMAVHGRYGEPCPRCDTRVQRIRYAENETNYCPRCQTDGRLLADRALSRLLKRDWPRTIDELERQIGQRAVPPADEG